MNLWHIQTKSEKFILTDINLVSKKERELKEEGIKYKTDYYVDNKLVHESETKLEGN